MSESGQVVEARVVDVPQAFFENLAAVARYLGISKSTLWLKHMSLPPGNPMRIRVCEYNNKVAVSEGERVKNLIEETAK